jgi:hypothetical protein
LGRVEPVAQPATSIVLKGVARVRSVSPTVLVTLRRPPAKHGYRADPRPEGGGHRGVGMEEHKRLLKIGASCGANGRGLAP